MKFQKKKPVEPEAPQWIDPEIIETAPHVCIVRALTRISQNGNKYLPGAEFPVTEERAASLVRSQAAEVVKNGHNGGE